MLSCQTCNTLKPLSKLQELANKGFVTKIVLIFLIKTDKKHYSDLLVSKMLLQTGIEFKQGEKAITNFWRFFLFQDIISKLENLAKVSIHPHLCHR